MIRMFTEKDGSFSWRKGLTGLVSLIFVTAQLGYLISHHFEELPNSYWQIDAGVFAFYFFKRTFENIKIGSK